jgi:hypothetical protein
MTVSPALLPVLLSLALINLALLVISLVGGVALLGWGSRLAFKAPGSLLVRGAWPVAFLILPGFTHLLFSLTRPTPPRFRLLAIAVTLSLTGVMAVSLALVLLMRAAGVEISTER